MSIPKNMLKKTTSVLSPTFLIRPVIEQVIADNEKSVSEYKAGKTQAMGYIMGQAMRALKGKAPAQEVQKILKEILG